MMQIFHLGSRFEDYSPGATVNLWVLFVLRNFIWNILKKKLLLLGTWLNGCRAMAR
jgi:hypothetical protein